MVYVWCMYDVPEFSQCNQIEGVIWELWILGSWDVGILGCWDLGILGPWTEWQNDIALYIYGWIWWDCIFSEYRVTFSGHLWSLLWIFGWFLFNKMYSNGSYIYVGRVLAKFYSWGVSRKCPKLHVFLVKNKGSKKMDAKRRFFTHQTVFALISTIFVPQHWNFTQRLTIHRRIFRLLFTNLQKCLEILLFFLRRSDSKSNSE